MTRAQAQRILNALDEYYGPGHFDARERLLEALEGMSSAKPLRSIENVDVVLLKVSKSFGVQLAEILSASREKHIVRARHVAMLMLRERDLSYPSIAKIMNKDHTSVMNGCKMIASDIARDERLRARIESLRNDIAFDKAG